MSDASMQSWRSAYLTLPSAIEKNFGSAPTRVALPLGTRIHRLRSPRETRGVVGAGEQILRSPWWFPTSTWHAIIRASESEKTSITGAARVGLAVRPHWNPRFDVVVIYSLLRSGYAFHGTAAPQSLTDDGGPQLAGGLEQWWIPGLERADVRLENYGSVAF